MKVPMFHHKSSISVLELNNLIDSHLCLKCSSFFPSHTHRLILKQFHSNAPKMKHLAQETETKGAKPMDTCRKTKQSSLCQYTRSFSRRHSLTKWTELRKIQTDCNETNNLGGPNNIEFLFFTFFAFVLRSWSQSQ